MEEYIIAGISGCVSLFELADDFDTYGNITELRLWIEREAFEWGNSTIILSFREIYITMPQVYNNNDGIRTINLPISYFERLYPLLKEANQKYKVKLVITPVPGTKKWCPQFEFTPIS